MNRLLVGVFALAAALQGTAAAAIAKDGSVLVLTDANFDDAIKVSTREKGGRKGGNGTMLRHAPAASPQGLCVFKPGVYGQPQAGTISGTHLYVVCGRAYSDGVLLCASCEALPASTQFKLWFLKNTGPSSLLNDWFLL